MNILQPVTLSSAKDPSYVGRTSSHREAQAMPWILRCAQNDRHRGSLGLIRTILLLSVFGFLSSVSAPATQLTDLGQGLAYLRVQSLGESEKDLRSAASTTGALVLDLRYCTANNDSVDALRAALASHAANAPVLILVSPSTPPAVADAIAKSPVRVLTLGIAGSVPGPTIVVNTDAETDRRAYDALKAGTSVETLISGKIEKERFDEATLVQEFKDGNHDAEPPPTPDPTAAKPAEATDKPPTPAVSPVVRLVDRVLQCAVYLHRTLLALRR